MSIPSALVLGCNDPVTVGVLFDWILDNCEFEVNFWESGCDDGCAYGDYPNYADYGGDGYGYGDNFGRGGKGFGFSYGYGFYYENGRGCGCGYFNGDGKGDGYGNGRGCKL